MKVKVTTDSAPLPAGPYSQAIVKDSRMYVAGQGPFNSKTGEKPETVEEQTRMVLSNIRSILEKGGFSMSDVVKVSAFLADIKDFKAFNEVYKEFFTDPFPVRTTIGCQLNGILVEIDVIAEK